MPEALVSHASNHRYLGDSTIDMPVRCRMMLDLCGEALRRNRVGGTMTWTIDVRVLGMPKLDSLGASGLECRTYLDRRWSDARSTSSMPA